MVYVTCDIILLNYISNIFYNLVTFFNGHSGNNGE